MAIVSGSRNVTLSYEFRKRQGF